jgi:hypothetical protein
VGGLPVRVLRFSPWRGWDFSSRENQSCSREIIRSDLKLLINLKLCQIKLPVQSNPVMFIICFSFLLPPYSIVTIFVNHINLYVV